MMKKPLPLAARLALVLVDEGKVSLDDPVEKYLPKFKGQMLALEPEKGHVVLKKPAHPITGSNKENSPCVQFVE